MQKDTHKGITVAIKSTSARGLVAATATLVLVLSPLAQLQRDAPAERKTVIVVVPVD
ncbi:hypothetical protein ACFRFH_05480 [Leifsonia sp. NPDC056824]|uniref:hypothetical protein n=1 Tax=Leifsonia sp. NPDC056824 TaxID=3345953 RepID=UPI0036A18C07